MNKNIIVVLAGGFLIAVIVAFIVSSGLKGNNKKDVVQEKKIKIIVAKIELFAGDEITEKNIKWQNWPTSNLIDGSIKKDDDVSLDDYIGQRVRYQISTGLPLLENHMVDRENGSMLSATLQQGMRAVSINVKAWSMVAGFIVPGDRVDVILSHQPKMKSMKNNTNLASTINKYASEIILENIKVLAIDQRSKIDEKKKDKAKVGKTVTLEVMVDDAEKLYLARNMGDLSLALRAVGDNKLIGNKDITTDVKISRVLKEISKSSGQSQNGTSGIVRIYSGSNVINMPVRTSPDQ